MLGEYSKLPWRGLIFLIRSIIPRCRFMLYLVLHHKSPTKDRPKKWGANIDEACTVCEVDNESIEHLFHGFSFYNEVENKFRIWFTK